MVVMASSSFKVRGKITTNRQNSSTGSDCYFIVNRSPVTPKKRDVSQFEDYRQRAFVQRKKDAFRTISYRSEPTIGEEDLARRSYLRKSVEHNGQHPNKTGYPVLGRNCEEMVQNLMPDCYEHIQNFHHYRRDLERLNSGFKVSYLSGNEKSTQSEKELRRVYGQKSKNPKPITSSNGHFQMLPKSKIRSVRMANMVSKELVTPPRKGKVKNSNKNIKVVSCCQEENLVGKHSQRTNEISTELGLNENKQRLPNEQDERQFNANNVNELPHLKLEQVPVNSVENQPSFRCLASDISGHKLPMTTPDDMSRRSSIRTFIFDKEEDFISEGNRASSSRNSSHKNSNPSHHYLTPFHSRFPHPKATSDSGSCQTRQKKCGDTEIPAWQQYRILCDAFRPNVTSEQALYQKRYPSGYKIPKFATAKELEYYINVVSETNNSSLHLSS